MPLTTHVLLTGRTLLGTALISMLCACTGVNEPKLLAEAQARLKAHDAAGTVVPLKALLQNRPDHATARALLAQAYQMLRQPEEAEAQWRHARESGLPAAEWAPGLAEALVEMGQSSTAVRELGSLVVAEAGAMADLQVQLARAHERLGEPEAAQQALRAALRHDPQHSEALLMKARNLSRSGHSEEARQIVQQAQALPSASARMHAAWGEDLAADPAKRKEAQQAFERALELNPAEPQAHGGLVLLALQHQDLPEAERALKQMKTAIGGHAMTVYLMATLAYLKGNLPQAREFTQALLKNYPRWPQVLLLAGLVEDRLGAAAAAEAHLTKALAEAPNSVEARRALAAHRLDHDQPDQAVALLTPLLTPTQADPRLWTLAGRAYVTVGQFARADAAFARAQALRPADATIAAALGQSLAARGQIDQAMRVLDTAASADKAGGAADFALASMLIARQDSAGALKALQALATKQPKSAAVQAMRGRVLEQAGQREPAHEAYLQALEFDPRFRPAIERLATLEARDGRLDAGRARLDALLKVEPRATWAMLAQAELSRLSPDAGAEAQAEAWLDRAVRVDPTDPATWLAAIDYQRKAGHGRVALERARQAQIALPRHPDILAQFVSTAVANGEHNQALAVARDLALLRPEDASAKLRVAEVLLAMGNTASALGQWRSAKELDANAPGLPQLGVRIALRDKAVPRALQLARQEQKRRPAAALGWELEAQVQATQAQPAAAIAALRTAVNKSDGADAARALHALLRKHHPAEAQPFATQWVKAHPQDVEFIAYLGLSAMRQRQWTEAEAHYRAASALRPESAFLLNELAVALQQAGKPGSLPLARRAVALAPRHPAMQDTLAQALAAERQWPDAVQAESRAVELAPHNVDYRLALVRLYLAQGDRLKAHTELNRIPAGRGDESVRKAINELKAEIAGG